MPGPNSLAAAVAALFVCSFAGDVRAQGSAIVPDLSKAATGDGWKVHNRAVGVIDEDERTGVRLDERLESGLAWIEGIDFTDGVIEVDLKGQNVVQRSFLGIAFRVVDGETYDAVYFRPFNFRHENELNRSHGVQYISHPVHTWNTLRTESPGQYEHAVVPVPDPNGWFHARITVSGTRVQVFVNDATEPSLSVETLGKPRGGPVGLWVGSGSGGAFANLRITPSPCAGPGHAQFDFWIGDWDVFTPSGAQAGTNRITREMNGCALVERWRGSRGVVGTSLNIYTPATGTWHQTWVDSSGTLLRLDGRFTGGSMRLEGEVPTPKGPARNRITWTPQPDGTVRQLWESSTDGGQAWTVVFDGTYRRR